jgi:hypothetical protein
MFIRRCTDPVIRHDQGDPKFEPRFADGRDGPNWYWRMENEDEWITTQ